MNITFIGLGRHEVEIQWLLHISCIAGYMDTAKIKCMCLLRYIWWKIKSWYFSSAIPLLPNRGHNMRNCHISNTKTALNVSDRVDTITVCYCEFPLSLPPLWLYLINDLRRFHSVHVWEEKKKTECKKKCKKKRLKWSVSTEPFWYKRKNDSHNRRKEFIIGGDDSIPFFAVFD